MDRLKSENEELKFENDLLKAQLKESFVIPYDSIGQYMMPVTFGLPELTVGEIGEYTTVLAWPKFPKGVEFDWKLLEGTGTLKNTAPNEAYKNVAFSYGEPGEKEERGVYKMTLPNGTEKTIMWVKPTVVK